MGMGIDNKLIWKKVQQDNEHLKAENEHLKLSLEMALAEVRRRQDDMAEFLYETKQVQRVLQKMFESCDESIRQRVMGMCHE